MSTELLIALLSLGSALIGLFAALIGRKKVVEIRYVNVEKTPLSNPPEPPVLPTKLRWYDKTGWLVFWTILFYPIGIYGILKSRAVSKNWKIIVIVCLIALIFASQHKV
ncbi:MAG: hypothetical protein RIT27_631 [Pseudomonadota bacterium]|jgi:hypothetical protein